MRYVLIALSLLLGTATPALAQVSIGISVPGMSIGINLPVYPELAVVPGYPVYYAPRLPANYFFYDGLYWVYHGDNWYVSTWYNGPWDYVEPDDVPLFVLRIPVRYYLAPPVYFHGWYVEAPPRWHHHWGPRWTRHYHGWENWDRRVVYAPAPLPVYQRHYAGDRYPRVEQQRVIHREHYRYQPRDAAVRRHAQPPATPRAQPAPQGRPDAPRAQRAPRERDDARKSAPAPRAVPQQREGQEQRQQPRQEPERRSQAPARSDPRGRPDSPREREDPRRPAFTPAVSRQRGPAVQPQRQPPRQEPDRQARQMPRSRDPQTAPRDQRDSRQRGDGRQGSVQVGVREWGQQDRGNERGNSGGNDRGHWRG